MRTSRKAAPEDAPATRAPDASAPASSSAPAGPQAMFVVWKGDSRMEGVAVKLHVMGALMRFLAERNGVPFLEGRHSFVITLPDVPDESGWFRERVLRYVSVHGGTGREQDEETARRLAERARQEDPEGARYVGAGLLRSFLEEMYMHYDVWREDDDRR